MAYGIGLLIVHLGMRLHSLVGCLHISTLLVFDLSAECIKFVHNGLQTLNAPRNETKPLNSSLFMELVIIIHAPVCFILFYWQAIGDPGQGWGNAILYVFMSPVVRKQLITNPLRKLIRKTGRVMMAVGGDSSNDEREEGSNVEENRQEELQNEPRVRGTPRLGRRRARSRPSENTLTSEVLDECEPTPCASPGPPPPGFHQPPHHPPLPEVSESTTETTTTSARLPV